ncbi:helix-turn-helix domain-containing protein [Micromonospora sp. LOL_024]|uniref:helix-turn-helix domain-containing protein n=1 Tax=Micromonospora sp. LOL_024 TaxID=3345412 RepID=UPI003A89F838
MPVPHARPITLTAAERRRLTVLAYSHTAGYQQVMRARIVCDAARGDSNAVIARRHEITVDTVRRWRDRFAEQGLAGLADRPRSGRPARFTPVQVAEVKALACQLPAETGTPLSKWTCPDLAAWVNEIEIYFSIVQRKVLTPNDFTSLDQVEDRLTAFEQRYNATARPFRWKFTPADLEDLMTRIERHEQKEQNLQQPDGCDHQPSALALGRITPEGFTT